MIYVPVIILSALHIFIYSSEQSHEKTKNQKGKASAQVLIQVLKVTACKWSGWNWGTSLSTPEI